MKRRQIIGTYQFVRPHSLFFWSPLMNVKILGLATLLCAFVSNAFSAPTLNVTPGGVQAGNWVWNIGITPDLSLIPDNSGTPLAVELGFRLSGGPLLSVINVNSSEF